MGSTSDPESKDSASSSVGECPHGSWRWIGPSPRTRKRCNWCGHEWVPLLPPSNPTGQCLHLSWEAIKTFDDGSEMRECRDCDKTWPTSPHAEEQAEIRRTSTVDCFHVETVRMVTPGGWVEQCVDCNKRWPRPGPIPQPRVPDFGPTDLTGATRAPMIGVAYAAGGRLFEVLLHQDATVTAEDGVLKVTHAGPIHGIVSVRPIYVPDPAGEEQSSAEAEDQ